MYACKSFMKIAVLLFSFYAAVSFAGDGHPIRWKEKNNRIIDSSVCYNHPTNRIDYKRCRSLAKKEFKKQCKYFEGKYEHTKHPYNQEFKSRKEKFCIAALTYNPLY